MPRYRIDLSYNGAGFHGWQIQNNAISVQEVLNNAVSVLLAQRIETVGCGRTDTGVHAENYTAHFDSFTELRDFRFIAFKLNCILPKHIAIKSIRKVNDDFHARYDAVSRTYKYFMHFKKNVFCNEYSMFLPYEIDCEKINRAIEHLLGTKDFSCFGKSRTDVKNNICTVVFARWNQNDEKAVFTITADRFLRNMVRAVVGTLIDMGRNKLDEADLEKIIEAGDRSKAGFSVPAQGLFLWEIKY